VELNEAEVAFFRIILVRETLTSPCEFPQIHSAKVLLFASFDTLILEKMIRLIQRHENDFNK